MLLNANHRLLLVVSFFFPLFVTGYAVDPTVADRSAPGRCAVAIKKDCSVLAPSLPVVWLFPTSLFKLSDHDLSVSLSLSLSLSVCLSFSVSLSLCLCFSLPPSLCLSVRLSVSPLACLQLLVPSPGWLEMCGLPRPLAVRRWPRCSSRRAIGAAAVARPKAIQATLTTTRVRAARLLFHCDLFCCFVFLFAPSSDRDWVLAL